MLNFFKLRNVNRMILGSSPVFAELTNTLTHINSGDDTGIDNGIYTTSASIVDNVEMTDITGLSALEKVAGYDNLNLFIDENAKLNASKEVGTNKTGSIVFRFVSSQVVNSNLLEYEVDIDGKDMANYVRGKSTGIAKNLSDSASIAEWGRLDAVENFDGTKGLADLEKETQTYLDNHKSEIGIPSIKPNPLKVDSDSYDIGDTVKVIIINGFINIDRNHLITKIDTRLQGNGVEELTIYLSPEGSNVLPSNFFRDITKIEKRLRSIEGSVLA